MLGRLFARWFWDTYDGLWRLAVANLVIVTVLGALFFFAGMPAVRIVGALAVGNPGLAALAGLGAWTLLGGVGLTLWMPGLLHFAGLLSRDREARLRDMWHGWRSSAGRLFPVALAACLVTGVIAINAVFYARMGMGSAGAMKWGGALLAGFCFWLEMLALASALHAMPLAVSGGRSFGDCMRLGVLITMRHPVFSLLSLLWLGILWVVSVFALHTAPIWVMGVSATATFVNAMHDVVVEREEAAEAAGAEAAKEGKKGGGESGAAGPAVAASWKEMSKTQDVKEADYDRYKRGIRDILRPWE